jgi:hypothetical protein
VSSLGTVVWSPKGTPSYAELQYPFIVGYHKRGRVVSDTLLAEYNDISVDTELRGNPSYLEVPASAVEDDEKGQDARYILCHNPLKAKTDEAFRVSALEEAEQALVEYGAGWRNLTVVGKQAHSP